MKRFINLAGLGVSALVLSACGTAGLDKKATEIDWSKGSVMVMSMSARNDYKPSYPVTGLGVTVKKADGPDQNTRVAARGAVDPGTSSTLLAQQLPPGTYKIAYLTGQITKFPFNASIDFAVEAPFDVAPRSVVYLGHLALANKERINADDQAAGPALPLLDQIVTGVSGGTLQVELMDKYTSDIAEMRQIYPALRNAEVVRAPLGQISLDRRTGSKADKLVVKPAAGS